MYKAENIIIALVFVFSLQGSNLAFADPENWKHEWPKTDFSKTSVDYNEILSGGPPKDGIPAIDNPSFTSLDKADHIKDTEPVIGVVIGGQAKAYPLQVLMWHEIVNDTLGGIPITVTFCPLCNASIVFDRRFKTKNNEDIILDFGTTGKLRRSDLVMYDRQSESWWQQFTGKAIVGELIGRSLKMLPARIESFIRFKTRNPKGQVLIPNNQNERAYGLNPYKGYDSLSTPFLYGGEMPKNISPLARVITSEGQTWSLDYLRAERQIKANNGLIIEWEKGQNSALDAAIIGEGVDIGNVIAYRIVASEKRDVLYSVDFAFAHFAFKPEIPIITK